MKLEFQEYQARKIVNVHKHVDGPWFWVNTALTLTLAAVAVVSFATSAVGVMRVVATLADMTH